ncbi:60 kDa chaperonin, putative [Plasmodium knowlesi strain H]|uniref:60 kDa chaperonin, putative n=3 Tax=Plasmodium knowlesi TaxID=5850 RepID=A0A5K1VKI4_PLAKH|nr:60 kDa chaperonin, putative [Plasmodium knowlesi strain H]OTN63625.1 putative 60 kDa chaperonin [Plasmodium knowlesi]CAA9991111.1 60 kDa chaperonin, putative [Plasmodium knowlesi strain H]SBO20580.1 60 kDa chaperonin, putative [Plasmodium knowlesi strain H]SBO20973.1 60 kDa chaperonin, putative [Plasmodium knowlesi strain H]VVS80585.1 60 kDa chaperonin, putative [Plasmodium knowlesi strain H]|eukprot:XP_002262395.1 chaperonin cpn60, putative [Plasmodium knowlesi strain H]
MKVKPAVVLLIVALLGCLLKCGHSVKRKRGICGKRRGLLNRRLKYINSKLISRRKENYVKVKMTENKVKGKDIIYGNECRNELLRGILTVSDVVKLTLGPRGRNVLLEKEYGSPLIINDGVTIAKNISLKDRKKNNGVKLMQESTNISNDKAGDGTSSTALMTATITSKGIEEVNKNHNPIPIQRGIQVASKMIIEKIKSLSTPIKTYKDILNIATIASNNDTHMGSIIANAYDKLGKNAAIILDDNADINDKLEFTEGYNFDRGIINPYLLYNENKDHIEYNNVSTLITDQNIDNIQSILPILEIFAKNKQPLCIIADDFSNEVLQTLIINKLKGAIKVVPIRAPSFGDRRKDYLKDLCIVTNSKYISADVGLDLNNLHNNMSSFDNNYLTLLGSANTLIVKKDRTSLITKEEYKNQIDDRIKVLKKELEETTSKYDKEKLNERIAALSGGIAKILIGGNTETEQKERKFKYEDATNAVKSAIDIGYVPGGGVTYLEIIKSNFINEIHKKIEEDLQNTANQEDKKYLDLVGNLESEMELRKMGANIVVSSLDVITKQIADNAGVNGENVVKIILNSKDKYGFGYDVNTNKFVNMVENGIIDSTNVIISVIKNSCSIASMVLTTECMMVDSEKKDKGILDSSINSPNYLQKHRRAGGYSRKLDHMDDDEDEDDLDDEDDEEDEEDEEEDDEDEDEDGDEEEDEDDGYNYDE